MKKPKNVSKLEKRSAIVQSLEYNSLALDFLKEEIHKCEDILNWNELDSDTQDRLSILKYLEFTLNYLDNTYNESLILLEACND